MGCLAVLMTGVFGLLVLITLPILLVTGNVDPALMLALALVGLAALSFRHLAAVRRAQRAERREQERAARRGRRPSLRSASRRPIDRATPLPLTWWQPLDAAHRAQRDYEAALASMRPGPLHERLQGALWLLRDGVHRCDELARRGAELDRQLRRLPASVASGREGERLQRAVTDARVRLSERSAAMALIAAQAAQIAVHQSVAGHDGLYDAVRDLETTVGGLAAAVDEVPPTRWASRRPGTTMTWDRRTSEQAETTVRLDPHAEERPITGERQTRP